MTALAVCDGEVVVRGGLERERCKVERQRKEEREETQRDKQTNGKEVVKIGGRERKRGEAEREREREVNNNKNSSNLLQ